jgi:hypothetical protein
MAAVGLHPAALPEELLVVVDRAALLVVVDRTALLVVVDRTALLVVDQRFDRAARPAVDHGLDSTPRPPGDRLASPGPAAGRPALYSLIVEPKPSARSTGEEQLQLRAFPGDAFAA